MLLCYLLYLSSHSHFPKASAQCLDKHKMSCSHRIDTHKVRYGAVKVVQVIPLVLLTTCNRWWGKMFECRGVVERGMTLMRKLLLKWRQTRETRTSEVEKGSERKRGVKGQAARSEASG